MKFLIVGGDKRTIKLAEMLEKEGHEIKTYGLECSAIQNIQELKEQKANVVIGPIPFSKDGESLNSQFAEHKISIDKLLVYIKGKTLIAGCISENLKEKMKEHNIKTIDIMDYEELVIHNTIATAEGTIEIAIANTEKNLHESKILILGFGKVAKTLALKLKGLSQQLTCAARKAKDLSWIETLGFNAENINNLGNNLNKYDIIINTVPQIILTKERLKNIKEDALVIDLASNPGGVDQDTIRKTNIKYIWALAIPRKSCTTFISKIHKTSDL